EKRSTFVHAAVCQAFQTNVGYKLETHKIHSSIRPFRKEKGKKMPKQHVSKNMFFTILDSIKLMSKSGLQSNQSLFKSIVLWIRIAGARVVWLTRTGTVGNHVRYTVFDVMHINIFKFIVLLISCMALYPSVSLY
ncbi:hypothetical protein ACJX0J_031625, partial [Zea mays]